MTKYPSIPVLLLAALLAAGVVLLTGSSAVGQEAADSDTPQQWAIPDYIDPFPYLQHVWVSPDGTEVFYDQIRELTGIEEQGSYWSYKSCMFKLDVESGDVMDVAEWVDRSVTLYYDVYRVDYSPDGKHLLVSLWARTKPTRTIFYIMDAKTKKVVGKMKEGGRGWACWLGDERIAVSSIVNANEYGAIRVHDLRGKQRNATTIRGRVLSASLDGTVLAVHGSKLNPSRACAPRYADMLAIDTTTGKVIASSKKLENQRGAWALISPGGDYVAFGRSCWTYRDDSARQYEVSVQPLNKDVPDKNLTILRKTPIIPVSVTDEGNTIVLTPAGAGGRTLTSLKIMNLDGMSRVIINYNACGAAIHGDTAYCIVDEDAPYIVAAKVDTEGDMLIDEKGFE